MKKTTFPKHKNKFSDFRKQKLFFTGLYRIKKSISDQNSNNLREILNIHKFTHAQLINQLMRTKAGQAHQIDELRKSVDEETKAKGALAHALQISRSEVEMIREQCEEEVEAKGELQRSLS